RFDIPLRAMTGVPRGRLLHAVENGFPQMPGGSQIVLDRLAEERVIDSIKSQLSLTTKALVSEVRENIPDGTNALEYRLSDYLAESGRGLPDIYKPGTRRMSGPEPAATWSAGRRLAFGSHRDSAIDSELAAQIMRRVNALTHVDDVERALEYRRIISCEATSDELVASPYAAMLYYAFWPKGDGGSIAESLDEIR